MANELPDGWNLEPLEDCMAAIIDYRGKTPRKTASGIPLITAKVVKGGRIETPDEFIDPAEYDDWMRRGLPLQGDVLVTTEAPLGEVAQLGPEKVALAQRLIGLRGKPGKLDNTFLKFLMQSEFVQSQLAARASGSTVSGIKQSELRKIDLLLPTYSEQKRIAHILGTLDDKIELNRRMNATLEAMARALFQSWFVDFDPVRAKAAGQTPAALDPATADLFPSEFEDSELGEIPKGWEVVQLGEVFDIFDSKRIPLSSREREARPGPYPYHGAASVMGYVDDYLFDGIHVLMGEDGSVVNDDGTPVLQYVWGKIWVNNHAHVLKGRYGVSTEHLYLHLQQTNIAPFVTGAVQPKLNQGNLKRVTFVRAFPGVCHAFAVVLDQLFAKVRANIEESRTLAALRDALLPKLLSGELNVNGAERMVTMGGR